MTRRRLLRSMMWASVSVTLVGVYAAVIDRERQSTTVHLGSVVSTPDISTGVTITVSTPPPVAVTSKAVPSITGPAPLPTEEQGLPGD